MYLLSVFGGGLFLIPLGFLIASIVSFYKGYKQWTSGTTITNTPRYGGEVTTTDTKERMSWFSIGANWFGIIFLACSIVSFLVMQSDK